MEAVLNQPSQAADETTLAERFRTGDTVAFDEIVTRYRQAVYAVSRRMLRSHEDADEAAQLTFVKAWNARSGFRGNARLKTWLVSIALNVSKTMLTSRRETQALPDEPGLPAPVSDPGARLDTRRRQDELRRAVAALPPRQRDVVMLKVYEDLTYREVAEILELSAGTVKAHLHQAVSNLRRGLVGETRKEKA